MRQIGRLPDENQARRLRDFLTTIDVAATIEADADEWLLWIHDEDHVERARKELATFRENPDAEQYLQAAPTARAIEKQSAAENKATRKRIVHARRRWDSSRTAGRRVTVFLIYTSVLVAVTSTSLGGRMGDLCNKDEPILKYLFIKQPVDKGGKRAFFVDPQLTEVQTGQVWRLLTPMFIHFDLLHLGMNMFCLWQLGGAVEPRQGSKKFLAMVLTISLIANVAQHVISGPAFGGMSGVVFGLFGYLWMKSKFDPGFGVFLPPNMVFLLLFWFIICFTGAVGHIANAAHTGGLITGMALGYLPIAFRMARR